MKNKGHDVYWTLPHQKRSFATCTISTNNLIEALSTDDKTVKDVYDSINYDEDAKIILKGFIDAGYKNFIMKDFITDNEGNPYYTYRKKEPNGDISLYLIGELKKVSSQELKRKNYCEDLNKNINLDDVDIEK